MGTENPLNAINCHAPLSWKKSLFWLAVAVSCFHAAYTSIHYPALGLLIFGYALGLVKLANQPTVRRAFYFGLATGFFCYGPQLWFFFKIFNVAAVVLWLVLAFWVGLFTAISCGCLRRWGMVKTAWLIPIIWTGLEYFRSELYYLKFSWLNVGYALPPCFSGIGPWHLGMYGAGAIVLTVAVGLSCLRSVKVSLIGVLVVIATGWLLLQLFLVSPSDSKHRLGPGKPISLVGIQMEFPPENVIPKILDKALAKNTNADLFVLSEYTLAGPVPDALKNWCRQHSRFLVVGGMDHADANNFYDTAFVVGTNGDIVFKQGKCVPIQFFHDGLPAPAQKVWDSPWGKIGFCVCYDLSYARVTDELVRQGAQMLIVPTMDVEYWSRHEHELHTRVAPVRAAGYGIPIFRLASSGISQAIAADGKTVAEAPMPGNGDFLVASLRPTSQATLPIDRYLAPPCTAVTAILVIVLPFSKRSRHGSLAK